jgi:hypothetical protein
VGSISAPSTGLSIQSSLRAANQKLVNGDTTKLIKITANSFAQTFDSVALLAAGWWVFYQNAGSGVVTLTPSGGELIDSLASVALLPGQGCVIACDGVGLNTSGRTGQGWNLIQNVAAVNQAFVDFSIGIDGTFGSYVLEIDNAVPSIDFSQLILRTSSDGGATFAAANGDYTWRSLIMSNAVVSGTASNSGTSSSSGVIVQAGTSNIAADGGVSLRAEIVNPASSVGKKHILLSSMASVESTPSSYYIDGTAYRDNVAAINAIRVAFSSGNITSAQIRLFGVKK